MRYVSSVFVLQISNQTPHTSWHQQKPTESRDDRSCSGWSPITCRLCFFRHVFILICNWHCSFCGSLISAGLERYLVLTPYSIHCRTLSALAHWSAIFGEVDYLALLSFPFVKLFQNNQLICFEMIATILGKSSVLIDTFVGLSQIKILARILNWYLTTVGL